MSTPIEELGKLIVENAVRVDRGTNDSIDVGFFAIIVPPDSDLTALRLKNAIERAEEGVHTNMKLADFLSQPEDGSPGPNYTMLGAWLGDQGLALAFMGLGNYLELWNIITPADVGVADERLYEQMIGMGFLHISVPEDSLIARSA